MGDGVVRAIAMGSSEGVSRGLSVDNTGAPISVPVGNRDSGTYYGCVWVILSMSVVRLVSKSVLSIHRAAPTYEELAANSEELLETGIKVIDLVCPFAKGR